MKVNNSDSIKIEIPSGLEFICDQLKEFHRLKQKEREEAAWKLWSCIFSKNPNAIGHYNDVLRQNIDEDKVRRAFNDLLERL